MKKVDIAYIAGIIDGEGSICLARSRTKDGKYTYSPLVEVAMTDDFICKWLHFSFGGCFTMDRRLKYPRAKLCARWSVAGQGAYDFLKVVYPYLILKKAQAEIAFKVFEGHPRFKHLTPIERYLQELEAGKMHELNKKGR